MRVRIEPRTLRQILRLLLTTNMSAGDIAHVVGVSRNSIRRIQEHLESVPTQTDPQEIDGWSDEQLFSRLQLAPFNSFFLKPHPDWNWVQKEMRERSVTLELLWREWRETEPAGICYSQFTALYAKFVKQLPIVMRQVHIPGEKLFVDFSGKTVPIYLEGLQEPRQAQIFVGVLGYSSYTFACAVWTQKIEDWVRCHARALTFFGGVPKYLVPDNLKAAVVFHLRSLEWHARETRQGRRTDRSDVSATSSSLQNDHLSSETPKAERQSQGGSWGQAGPALDAGFSPSSAIL